MPGKVLIVMSLKYPFFEAVRAISRSEPYLLIFVQVLHTTVVKQNAFVEALESVQESSRVRVCPIHSLD
jgi:hypothetical protein